MLIRLVSDLHLEHFHSVFATQDMAAKTKALELVPIMENDDTTTLVVCGDMAPIRHINLIINFLSFVCPRFKHVIYVFGNHEHYGSNMDESMQRLDEALQHHIPYASNIYVASNEPKKFVLDDVTFLCGTMWTDYGTGHPDEKRIQSMVARYITDHVVITRSGGGGYSPAELAQIHSNTVSCFADWMSEKNEKVVVCTHHMPSFQAVDPVFIHGDIITRSLNHAFASNLDEFILRYQPTKWLFGHTHTPYRGMIGATELICNPGGYPKERNLAREVFNPFLRFEV